MAKRTFLSDFPGGGGEDISGGGSRESTIADEMRSGAVLTVLLTTLTVIWVIPEVKENNVAKTSARAMVAETVLTDEEKMLVKEEAFLEKLFF